MVSSCEYFPWMIEVCALRAWLSTAFHTCKRPMLGTEEGLHRGSSRQEDRVAGQDLASPMGKSDLSVQCSLLSFGRLQGCRLARERRKTKSHPVIVVCCKDCHT